LPEQSHAREQDRRLGGLTEEDAIKIIYEEHGLLLRIADRLGYKRNHVKTYMDHRPRVAEALKIARGEISDVAHLGLWNKVKAEDWRAIQFVLSSPLGSELGFGPIMRDQAQSPDYMNVTAITLNVMEHNTFAPEGTKGVVIRPVDQNEDLDDALLTIEGELAEQPGGDQ
jgi:hypothetical protein